MSSRNTENNAIIGQAIAGVFNERRTGHDRRSGVDRRNCSIPVEHDRRGTKPDRRSGLDRRAKGLEDLEQRRMFSAVSFEDGILMLRGNAAAANDMLVAIHQDTFVASVGGRSAEAAMNKVRFIRVIGGEKADSVRVDPGITVPVYVQTGAGNDTVFTAGGNDFVAAGNGADWIETGAGNDTVLGGNGRDTLILGAGNDKGWGGNGSDQIRGGKGNDSLVGQSGDDRAFGEAGDDRIDVGAGTDRARGGAGTDTLIGESKDDLKGNAGSDRTRINVGGIIDVPTGDLPEDFTLSLINADTNRVIAGFESLGARTTIDLSRLPTRNLNIVANLPTDFGGSLVYKLNGNVVRTENTAPHSLAGDSAGDFKNWTPALGQNTITATAFSGPGGTGQASTPINVRLTVVDTGGNNTGGNNTGGNNNNNTGNTGGVTGPVNGNEDPNPNAAAPVARISALTTNVQAGHTIHVHGLASQIFSGSQLSAKFNWDFGDPGSKFNKAEGFNAAHNYTRPGNYTITLGLTDNTGKSDNVTINVNVAASTRKVIFVSNDGDDAADGLSPANPIRTWDRARGLVGDNVEFRFRAGDTFSVKSTMWVSFKNVFFGMYGNGQRPTLLWDGAKGLNYFINCTQAARDTTVRDLQFDSIFTNHQEKPGVPYAIQAGDNLSAINCQILNVCYFVNTELEPAGVLVQENVAPLKTGMRGYMTYVMGTDQVYQGNTISNSTREHCIRVDKGTRILIANNDLTNIAQAKPGDKVDMMKQTITVHNGSDVSVIGNKTSGGRVEIGPLGELDGFGERSKNTHLDRILIADNDMTFGMFQRLEIDHGTTGALIRGNRIVTPQGAGIAVQARGKFTNWPAYGERHVANVWITSNNDITAPQRVSVGRGSVNINVANANDTGGRSAAIVQSAGQQSKPMYVTDGSMSGFSSTAGGQDLYSINLDAA